MRGDPFVRDGQDRRGDAEGLREFGNDLVHRAAFAQESCAVDGGGEVAVAEVEPASVAEAPEGIDDGEGVAFQTPAGLGIDHAGEGVDDDVGVGGDVEAEHLDVVGDVGDDGDGGGVDDLHETLEESGSAHAAGEHGIHAGVIVGRGKDMEAQCLP